MEATIKLQPSAYFRDPPPGTASELRLAVFAPPLVEPFQPSMTLPYLDAQLRFGFGITTVCHNLSSKFYVWLFRALQLDSMSRYRDLSKAIGVLRSPEQFYDSEAYHKALACLDDYALDLAEKDRLPYSLYPSSRASAIADSDNYRALLEAMKGSYLERFLCDYIGFTMRLEAYDVIGFSATNAFQLASSLFMARMLKQAGFPSHILLGGHAVAVAGRKVFDDLELTGCIDSVVLSGGADVFATVCDDIVKNKVKRIYNNFDAIKPLDPVRHGLFPTEEPYQLRLTQDLSDDLYLSPHHAFSIYSALGCSYGACTFCGSNRVMSPYVPRTIPVLLDEIENLKQRYGITHFDICDNNFDPNRISAFCAEIAARGSKFFWQCTSRVYNSLTQPLLRQMRQAGCVLMNIGLESASNRILRIMRKGYTDKDIEQVLVNTQAAGMPVHLYVICGFPTETVEESETTLAFLRRHLRSSHSVYFQNYEAQLASKIFSSELGDKTDGYSAARLIAALLEDPSVARDYVSHGNLVRRRGYPFIEGHNFLYLTRENALPKEAV